MALQGAYPRRGELGKRCASEHGPAHRRRMPGPPPRDPVAGLHRVQLFADMNRRQAEQFARLLNKRRFAKGETVIMEGSGGAAFFLIDAGEATVPRKGIDVATLGPGDYVGEIARSTAAPARPR